jgi:hypothetical protein
MTGEAQNPDAGDAGPSADPALAVEALADALQEAGARLEALGPDVQARRWARQRSIRMESSAELLRVLLSALGYPTRDGTSEFSTFDPDKIDPPTTRSLRRTVKAILADLEAVAKAPWPAPEPPAGTSP